MKEKREKNPTKDADICAHENCVQCANNSKLMEIVLFLF